MVKYNVHELAVAVFFITRESLPQKQHVPIIMYAFREQTQLPNIFQLTSESHACIATIITWPIIVLEHLYIAILLIY